MKENTILIVGEGVVYFLVPYDAAVRLLHQMSTRALGLRLTYADVYQLNPKGIANQVVGQHRRALQSGVGPFGRTWVCDVQAGDGDG